MILEVVETDKSPSRGYDLVNGKSYTLAYLTAVGIHDTDVI